MHEIRSLVHHSSLEKLYPSFRWMQRQVYSGLVDGHCWHLLYQNPRRTWRGFSLQGSKLWRVRHARWSPGSALQWCLLFGAWSLPNLEDYKIEMTSYKLSRRKYKTRAKRVRCGGRGMQIHQSSSPHSNWFSTQSQGQYEAREFFIPRQVRWQLALKNHYLLPAVKPWFWLILFLHGQLLSLPWKSCTVILKWSYCRLEEYFRVVLFIMLYE